MLTLRSIEFFKKASGKSPIEEFLDKLPAKYARKITWVMSLIEDLEKIPELYFKKLHGTNDIWEIRVQSFSRTFRLLGFFAGKNFVVTNGFCKKSQKTPLQQICLAETRKAEYFNRKTL